ncbi:MAG: rod shape-determining protein RodA [Candidatus Omnitrophica bacterium]|nr:rod shape-determining protein RodA [Candidatus Omnitrophota bacterium]
MLTRRELRRVDRPLLIVTLLLLGIGLLALYSASLQKTQATGIQFLMRQLTWAPLGLLLAGLLLVVEYHRWLEWAYLLYGVNMLLLLMVLEMGVVRGGAQRWLTFAGLTVQPSEFAKVTTVLALARYLGSRSATPWGRADSQWKAIGVSALLALIPMVLILKEPNLGTASVFLPILLAMLLVWGIRPRVIGLMLAAGALLAPFAWGRLADYQRSRLLVFLNPSLDPLGAGYTVVQSKIAIGSGRLWGKGWLAGTQNQLNFLPERHTDFIFSVVGEEWGFLGTTFCLALFGLLFYRGILIATQTRDPFGRLLVVGLVAMLATHLVVNTGMTLGLMPVVGLPLPFFSYGGSWLLTSLTTVGIILSIGIRNGV